MLHRKVLALVVCAGVMGLMMAASVWANDASADASLVDRVAKVESANADASKAGHNAWMLTSCALVLFMTAPGLAMFYGGLVRKKNVLGVMMQCVFLMGLMTVIWALYGYSLSFGGDVSADGISKWIGNDDYFLMKGVEHQWVVPEGETKGAGVAPPYNPDNPGGISMLTHMLFQGMFFIITPALICGAFAERMKFSTMVVFSVLWGTFVYCPLCHWVWDGGILAFGKPWAYAGGALDFAGGTVVHISSGTSALVCALVLGKRLGFGSQPMPPHNMTYTILGAAMLWVGWFGFNAGSELASDDIAAAAFAATHFAAAAGALAWAGMEWLTRGKPSALGAASGLVAGLVCITPASGFVTPMPALIMGAAAGVVCFYACTTLKSKFGYDDSLDAFGVHGVGGTLGALLTGVFATRAVSDMAKGAPLGLLEGGDILKGQVVAVAVTWVFSIGMTFVILKVLDAVMGLRVSQQGEIQGLDLSQHGEEGYIFL
ncbi:MAG: ammonium transporter [Pirellulales bacterium]